MQDEHDTPTNGVPNVSEASDRLSESFGNEHDSASERDELFRKESASRFGKNPPASERNTPFFPKASEHFRSNTPPASETIDEILSRPERLPAHTLTAREVEKLFEQAGRPVTERSILNWCKPNSEGICRLNCGYERGERRWYISPDSVERVIDEERKKDQSFPKESLEFSEASDRLSESFGNEHDSASERNTPFFPKASEPFRSNTPPASETLDASPHDGSVAEHRGAEQVQAAEALKKERDDLQRRLIELEREAAAGQYKDELITTLRERLNEDRQDYNERMKFFQNQVEKLQTTTERYVGELVGINRRVGQLEAENRTLRQLPAGRPETRDVRDVYDPNSPRPEESPRDAYGSAYTSEAIHDQPDNQPPFHV